MRVAYPTYKGKFVKREVRTVYRDAKGRFTTKDKAVKTQQIEVFRQKGKFIPRKAVRWRTVRVKPSRIKKVAVYGRTKSGKTKRWHIYGTPKNLQKAVAIAVKNPPKRRAIKVEASKLILAKNLYVDKADSWDTYEVES